MAEESRQTFASEMQKNARGSQIYGLVGLAIGAIAGAAFNARAKINGWEMFSRITDIALIGWIVGEVASLWSRNRRNHASAYKMDATLKDVRHENELLKLQIESLGTRPHTEVLAEKRAQETQEAPAR